MRNTKILILVSTGMLFLDAATFAESSTNSVIADLTAFPIESQDARQKESRLKAQVLTDHARLEMENGRLEEAEKTFRRALQLDSNNRPASYYLILIKERKAAQRKASVQQIDASVQPIYPLIRNLDGSLHYGVPVHKQRLREIADDLNRR